MAKPYPNHKICYVRWLDANYQEGEHVIDEIDQLCELHYVGVLVKETEDAITLSLECPQDGTTRNPFSILKRNIQDMRVVDFRKCFPNKRQPKKEKVEPRPTEAAV